MRTASLHRAALGSFPGTSIDSSHADESIRFTRDPGRASPSCPGSKIQSECAEHGPRSPASQAPASGVRRDRHCAGVLRRPFGLRSGRVTRARRGPQGRRAHRTSPRGDGGRGAGLSSGQGVGARRSTATICGRSAAGRRIPRGRLAYQPSYRVVPRPVSGIRTTARAGNASGFTVSVPAVVRSDWSDRHVTVCSD